MILCFPQSQRILIKFIPIWIVPIRRELQSASSNLTSPLKYLGFEQEHGTPNHVEHVKGLARAYVEGQAERAAARVTGGDEGEDED